MSKQACSFNEDLAQDLLHETIFMILHYYDIAKIEDKYKSESDKVNYIIRCIKNQRYSKTSYFTYKYIKNKPVNMDFELYLDYIDVVDEPDDEDYLIKMDKLYLELNEIIKRLTFFERYLYTEIYELGKNPYTIGKDLAVPRGTIYKNCRVMQTKLKKLLEDKYEQLLESDNDI